MSIFQSIILGIVQGLTEFLPVSSSGHIELGKVLLGIDANDFIGIEYTILVHVATALASVIVFYKDILAIIEGLLEFRNNFALNYAGKLILSSIPVVIIGLLFEKQLDALFSGNIVLVGGMLLVTALLLFLTTRVQSEGKVIGYGNAIVIGLAQMCAILPGISRSGATIATALLMNVDKERAARFSFLMVLIPIFGKALLDAKTILADSSQWTLGWDITIAGFMASFISGLFACTIMLRIVKRGKLYYFSIYCVIVGVLAIVSGFL